MNPESLATKLDRTERCTFQYPSYGKNVSSEVFITPESKYSTEHNGIQASTNQ